MRENLALGARFRARFRSYVGKTFLDFAVSAGARGVTVVAVQVDGYIQLNPGNKATLRADSVVFATVHTDRREALDALRDGADGSVRDEGGWGGGGEGGTGGESSVCTNCASGKFSPAGASICTSCDAGKYR